MYTYCLNHVLCYTAFCVYIFRSQQPLCFVWFFSWLEHLKLNNCQGSLLRVCTRLTVWSFYIHHGTFQQLFLFLILYPLRCSSTRAAAKKCVIFVIQMSYCLKTNGLVKYILNTSNPYLQIIMQTIFCFPMFKVSVKTKLS